MTPRLTSDARAALEHAGLSRRRFLQGAGAMVVAFASSGGVGRVGEVLGQGIEGRSSQRLVAWIAYSTDGVDTAYPVSISAGLTLSCSR